MVEKEKVETMKTRLIVRLIDFFQQRYRLRLIIPLYPASQIPNCWLDR